ncbi:glycerophosphoryl diester phosphodiesterase [Singulisphaera sp. GP187]|uniref:glycerophosphodiester phosphodiesterase n=1 Tax=Singulisphaera sp. GP187 TaxID=1882752 RepID=UPI00092AEC88|nr:glycerophosphodiester phosphodiesterase [Singulisphaera sp. GP187]SIO40240.1 glycerophosphoryl diester phosphodiesterase [Singulisphaera sp. GP187]
MSLVNVDRLDDPAPASASASMATLARGVLGDFQRILMPLVLFEVAFKGLVYPLWLFGTVWLLPAIVATADQGAVTNKDIVAFMLSPRGLLVGLIAGVATIWLFLFEHLGVMFIAAMSGQGLAFRVGRVSQTLAAAALRVLRIGFVGLAALIVTSAPFAILAGIIYIALFTRHDINLYLSDRPTSFYLGLGIGLLLLAGAVVVGFSLCVRWVFALPIVLLEGLPGQAALGESWRRGRGAFWRVATILLGWEILGLGLSAILVGAFRGFSALALNAAGYHASVVIPLVISLLAGHGLLLAALSFVMVTVHSLLILRLYAERGGTIRFAVGEGVGDEPDQDPAIHKSRKPHPLRLWMVVSAMFVGFVAVVAFGSTAKTDAGQRVEITAHRGDARRHPENTLSAIQGAIEAGADYAEIDVHETADGAIVLLHDDDLMRMAGDPRTVWDLTLDEIRQVDVGRRFSPAHVGERVPTLEEAINLARGKIKLNIELKFRGRNRQLAGAVARLIRHEQFESECVVASLTYDGLIEAKRHNPQLRTAAVITYAIGDMNRLNTDVLSVNRNFLTTRLIRRAHALGKEVYVWTVNDPRQMVELIERGVTNIITNEPQLLVSIRRERENLNEVERRLLAARYFLDIKP